MRGLLGLASSWNDYFNEFVGKSDENLNNVLGQVFHYISIVLWVVLGIVGAIGAVYAIFLGVQLARAEEQGKRDDAKKHLITVFIAIGVTIVLILVFNVFLPMLLSAFVDKDSLKLQNGGTTPAESLIQPWLSLVKAHL